MLRDRNPGYNPETGDLGATPEIYRNDLLRAVIYPDSDDPTDLSGNGADGLYDRLEYKYNRQGELTELKDQVGTVHEYSYDKLGRQTVDKISTLGTGIDGAVRRIERTFNVRGLLEKLTRYDAATGGNVLGEVVREYNDLEMLAKEYQEHEGAKDAYTLYVQYNYDDTADGNNEYTKGLRQKSVRYPNGRLVHFTYGSSGSDADNLNRLDAVKDDSGGQPGSTLAQYTWVGLGTMVVEDFQQPDVKLDYFGGTSGTYAGFDAFDRVIDQQWYDYGASAVRDRYTYGYDRASNRLYRENVGPSGKDEFYKYDGMYQLKEFDRGDLDAPLREEDFTLDPTGNWSGYVQKISGSTQLNQSRTHNKANEVTDITETVGPAWATPAHDPAGNMTTVPDPLGLTAGLTLKYDAWNRLVEVKDGTEVVAQYEYDGLNRRVLKRVPVTGQGSASGGDPEYETDYYFHNAGWQVLETRRTDQSSASPDNLQPKYQYVWSGRYIDSPVLRDENTDFDNLCDDQRLYYLTDANFNVTTLVDTNGDAVERYLYDPYGKVTIYTGDWTSTRSSSLYNNVYLYTGREYDPETGLYHYRRRPYTVDLARFLSRDAIASDLNLYRYCGNRPTTARDPGGLAWKIHRDPEQSQARVCNTSSQDSIAGLANAVFLDASEYNGNGTGWLEVADNGGIPATAQAQLGRAGRVFKIPNVVVYYQSKLKWYDIGMAVNTAQVEGSLRAAEFHIKGFNVQELTDGTRDSFIRSFRSRHTYGFMFAGHGSPYGLIYNSTLDDQQFDTAIDPTEVTRPFKLAFLYLFACYSAAPFVDNSQAGRPVTVYWSRWVSKRGLFIGACGRYHVWKNWTTWTGASPP